MIRQAAILAAGTGSRLRVGGSEWRELPKPLHQVAGQPLIRLTLASLAAAGVQRVAIVVGFMADTLIAAVQKDAAISTLGLDIIFVRNADYQKSNGVSVMVAAQVMDGPFLLSMSDHVYQPQVASVVAAADMSAADLYLAVDSRLTEIYDMDDATKVQEGAGFIQAIGKQLTAYNCVDCGVFAVSHALVSELQRLYDESGDCSLSAGVQALAHKLRARTIDIGTSFWQDVDTPDALQRATSELQRLGSVIVIGTVTASS